MRSLLIIFAALTFVGCSAALVPASSNPDTKLTQAKDLMSLERAIPAERLVREAIDIYKEQNNVKGLANAYAQYGLMLISPVYRKYEKFWRDGGSYDPTPKTAINYLEQSLLLYGQADDPEGQRFASFQLGRLFQMDGENKKACHAYDQSTQYHQIALNRFPQNKYYIAPGTKSWEDMISKLKVQLGCI